MTSRRAAGIHPIFQLCSKLTVDSFWSEILKKCAAGKFPRGVRFENGTLRCTRKRLSFSERIPTGNPTAALEAILTIFRDRLNIKSKDEKKNDTAIFDEIRLNQAAGPDLQWKQIKRKALKESLLDNYVRRFSKQRGLSNEEASSVMTLLHLALDTKIITSDDVVMENSMIVDIAGLEFDVETCQPYLTSFLRDEDPEPNLIPTEFDPVKQLKLNDG